VELEALLLQQELEQGLQALEVEGEEVWQQEEQPRPQEVLELLLGSLSRVQGQGLR